MSGEGKDGRRARGAGTEVGGRLGCRRYGWRRRWRGWDGEEDEKVVGELES